MRRLIPFALAGALALTSVACGSDDGGDGSSGGVVSTIAGLTGDQASGKTEYEKQCAGCHGKDGTGGVGPNIIAAPKADLSAEAMITAIVDGKSSMPSYTDKLSNQQIADVVAYVRGDLKAGK